MRKGRRLPALGARRWRVHERCWRVRPGHRTWTGGEAQSRRAHWVWVGICPRISTRTSESGSSKARHMSEFASASAGKYDPAAATFAKQMSIFESIPASAARRPATQSGAILPSPARRSKMRSAVVTNLRVVLGSSPETGLAAATPGMLRPRAGRQRADKPFRDVAKRLDAIDNTARWRRKTHAGRRDGPRYMPWSMLVL